MSSVFETGSCLLAFDSALLLDPWQDVMRYRSREETLRRLLDPNKPKIIFTNPDILFLILGLPSHAEPEVELARVAGRESHAEPAELRGRRKGKALEEVPKEFHLRMLWRSRLKNG